MLQSSCESAPRAGCDGYKHKSGSKVHIALHALGQLHAMLVTPADEQEGAQVRMLFEQEQQATGHSVDLARAAQSYTGELARQAGQDNVIDLQIVNFPEARRGFALPPKCWVVERSFGGWQEFAACRVTVSGCRKF